MEGFEELVLSLPKLPMGERIIFTEVGTDFFTQFEDSPIGEAAYDIKAVLDKKPGLYILDVTAEGWYATTCDRCLVPIQLPTTAQYRYYFQEGGVKPEEGEEDVIVIEENAVVLDLRPMVFETIVLSMPMVNVYDCSIGEDPEAPCDKNVLSLLKEGEDRKIKKENPVWDVLKNIDFKD